MIPKFAQILSLAYENPKFSDENLVTVTNYKTITSSPITTTSTVDISSVNTFTVTVNSTRIHSITTCPETTDTYVLTVTEIETQSKSTTDTYILSQTLIFDITSTVTNSSTETIEYCTSISDDTTVYSTEADSVITTYDNYPSDSSTRNQSLRVFNNSFGGLGFKQSTILYTDNHIAKDYKEIRNNNLDMCLDELESVEYLTPEKSAELREYIMEFIIASENSLKYESKAILVSGKRYDQALQFMACFSGLNPNITLPKGSYSYKLIQEILLQTAAIASLYDDRNKIKSVRDYDFYNFIELLLDENITASFADNLEECLESYNQAISSLKKVTKRIVVLKRNRNEIYSSFLNLFLGPNETIIMPNQIEVQKYLILYKNVKNEIETLKMARIAYIRNRDVSMKNCLSCFVANANPCVEDNKI